MLPSGDIWEGKQKDKSRSEEWALPVLQAADDASRVRYRIVTMMRKIGSKGMTRRAKNKTKRTGKSRKKPEERERAGKGRAPVLQAADDAGGARGHVGAEGFPVLVAGVCQRHIEADVG